MPLHTWPAAGSIPGHRPRRSGADQQDCQCSCPVLDGASQHSGLQEGTTDRNTHRASSGYVAHHGVAVWSCRFAGPPHVPGAGQSEMSVNGVFASSDSKQLIGPLIRASYALRGPGSMNLCVARRIHNQSTGMNGHNEDGSYPCIGKFEIVVIENAHREIYAPRAGRVQP